MKARISCWIICLGVSFFIHGQSYVQTRELKLSTPEIRSESIFFNDRTSLQINLAMEGIEVYYTEDGSIPTKNSSLYKGPFKVDKSASIIAKAWHAEFKSSDVVELQLHKVDAKNEMQITLEPNPSDSYPGDGVITLTDGLKGSMNFRDGKWLGFSSRSIEFKVRLKKAIDHPVMVLSMLQNQDAWIFLPKSIEVFIEGELAVLWEKDRLEDQPKSYEYAKLTIPRKKAREMVIQVNMDELPAWHPGAGNLPWLFIDEIFIQN